MTWGSHEVRPELDILVVHYKSVRSVTVSIGEISFSLLARLESREWGLQGYCSPIMQPVNEVQFPVQPGWWKQSISTAKRRHLAGKRPYPSALGAKVTLKVPPAGPGGARSPNVFWCILS